MQREIERRTRMQFAFYKPRGVGWGDDLKLRVVTRIVRSY